MCNKLSTKGLKAPPISELVPAAGREEGLGRGFPATEINIYGSSRIGMLTQPEALTENPSDPVAHSQTLGLKVYEFSNHLGNVLTTFSDRKIAVENISDQGHVAWYTSEILSSTDYYPFGFQMPGRVYEADGYRYGFQGQEDDPEVHGSKSTSIYFKYRIHDTRIGRFLSVDPLVASYPYNSSYAFAENRVIDGIELEGLEYYDCNLLLDYETSRILKLDEQWVTENFDGVFIRVHPMWGEINIHNQEFYLIKSGASNTRAWKNEHVRTTGTNTYTETFISGPNIDGEWVNMNTGNVDYNSFAHKVTRYMIRQGTTVATQAHPDRQISATSNLISEQTVDLGNNIKAEVTTSSSQVVRETNARATLTGITINAVASSPELTQLQSAFQNLGLVVNVNIDPNFQMPIGSWTTGDGVNYSLDATFTVTMDVETTDSTVYTSDGPK
jgi:RHS repeat-associated protein